MKKILKSISVLLLAALLLSACGTAAAPQTSSQPAAPAAAATEEKAGEAAGQTAKEPVTLKVGLLGKSIKPVGVLVADAPGYFEEEGVQVEFQKVSSMNDAYIAVSEGDLDVYLFSSTAAATFITQGITTLRVFGGTAAEGSEIMAAKGTPEITGVEDLLGKTIACQMPETGQMVLKNYLKENGYTIGAPEDKPDVAFIYVNDGNTAVEGCVKGEYDYCITNSCLGYYADSLGAALVGSVKQFVETYPCCRQTCYQKTYEDEFDALVAFEIATLRGHAYYLENEEKTLDILEAYAGQDRDFLKAQVYGTEDYTPVMRLSLDPDKKACLAFYEAMANLGEITDTVEVDWDTYVVSDVYEAALKELSRREPDEALWKDLTAYFNEHD